MTTKHGFRRRPLLAVGLAAGAALGGCSVSEQAALAPAPGAAVPASEVTEVEVQGVTVTARAHAWPGEMPISDDVTPLRVTFRNRSDRPVRLRYRELALVGGHQRFAALPLVEVDTDVEVPRLAEGYPTVMTPLFTASRFEVAPYYRPMYPSLDVYTRPFAFDPVYNETWFDYWSEVEQPTPEMVARALPEGVLQPGGSVDGFVFFEALDPGEVETVRFRADIVDARTGEILGVAEIPFVVTEAEEEY